MRKTRPIDGFELSDFIEQMFFNINVNFLLKISVRVYFLLISESGHQELRSNVTQDLLKLTQKNIFLHIRTCFNLTQFTRIRSGIR